MKYKRQGTFLGAPYDWRKPTWEKIKHRMWNKKDTRIMPPKLFGWGWTINFYQLLKRLRFVK